MSGVLCFLLTGWKSKFQKQKLFHYLAFLCQPVPNVHCEVVGEQQKRGWHCHDQEMPISEARCDMGWLSVYFEGYLGQCRPMMVGSRGGNRQKFPCRHDPVCGLRSKTTEHCQPQVLASIINRGFEDTFQPESHHGVRADPFLAWAPLGMIQIV